MLLLFIMFTLLCFARLFYYLRTLLGAGVRWAQRYLLGSRERALQVFSGRIFALSFLSLSFSLIVLWRCFDNSSALYACMMWPFVIIVCRYIWASKGTQSRYFQLIDSHSPSISLIYWTWYYHRIKEAPLMSLSNLENRFILFFSTRE